MRLRWKGWLWLACLEATTACVPAIAATVSASVGVTIVAAPVRAAAEIDVAALARLLGGIDDGAMRTRVVAISSLPASTELQRITVEFN